MVNYEPELMYALDSKSKYADWKNVYNVSGSDVLYCPICLGRVKLWNGQDPNKAYKKQRCFHHIDGMCSQESRIHFAYKTWLLEQGSKFKVGETIYEVVNSEIEKTFHTKFGDYRPDITVETTEGKSFYIEIADTNKKNGDYISKWHELSNDVLELDVNEQLTKVSIKEIPNFKLIYSSTTGMCFVKEYISRDYDEITSQLNKCWSRYDLMTRKLLWEKFDWFWKILRDYFSNKTTIEKVCETYKSIDNFGKHFIYTRFKTSKRHTELKETFKNIINTEFVDFINKEIETAVLKENFILEKSLHSKTIYKITVLYTSSLRLVLYEKKIKQVGGVWDLNDINLKDIISKAYEARDNIENKLIQFENMITTNKHVKSHSYYVRKCGYYGYYYRPPYDEYINYDHLYVKCLFDFDTVFLKNDIYTNYLPLNEISTEKLEILYAEAYNNKFHQFTSSELYKYVLGNDIEFKQILNYLNELCLKRRGFNYGTSNNFRELYIYHLNKKIYSWHYNDEMQFGKFEKNLMETIKRIVDNKINEINSNKNKKAKITRCLKQYIEKINNCPNEMWKFRIDSKKRWIIELLDYEYCYDPALEEFPDDNIESFIKFKILEIMNHLLDCLKNTKTLKTTSGYYHCPTIRIMEER